MSLCTEKLDQNYYYADIVPSVFVLVAVSGSPAVCDEPVVDFDLHAAIMCPRFPQP